MTQSKSKDATIHDNKRNISAPHYTKCKVALEFYQSTLTLCVEFVPAMEFYQSTLTLCVEYWQNQSLYTAHIPFQDTVQTSFIFQSKSKTLFLSPEVCE